MTGITIDVYDDIFLPKASDHAISNHTDKSVYSFPTHPSLSNDSDINEMNYCPFDRRLVSPRIYLYNPWSFMPDSKPDIKLVGSDTLRSDPLATINLSSPNGISDVAAPFKFSAPLYNATTCSPCVYTPVHPLVLSPRLLGSKFHLRF